MLRQIFSMKRVGLTLIILSLAGLFKIDVTLGIVFSSVVVIIIVGLLWFVAGGGGHVSPTEKKIFESQFKLKAEQKN